MSGTPPAKTIQEMNIFSGGRLIRRGYESVLKDRELWPKGEMGEKFPAVCKKKKKRGYTGDIISLTRRKCCARRMLSAEPDFAEQKSRIEELIEERGHSCLFYPKYHCELNHIEMYWGWTER